MSSPIPNTSLSSGVGSIRKSTDPGRKPGGHETVAGDVDGDGDIGSKPWTPDRNNAIGGKSHFSYLENLLQEPSK